ncbi:hypothetical protein ABZY04_22125, partial [Streptomyces sp. NPDC002922]
PARGGPCLRYEPASGSCAVHHPRVGPKRSHPARTLPFDRVAEGFRAMGERHAIKVLPRH